ncbi:hypothetical protein EMIT0194MI4_20595 [Pseudomonas sp. IT-194MI4]
MCCSLPVLMVAEATAAPAQGLEQQPCHLYNSIKINKLYGFSQNAAVSSTGQAVDQLLRSQQLPLCPCRAARPGRCCRAVSASASCPADDSNHPGEQPCAPD